MTTPATIPVSTPSSSDQVIGLPLGAVAWWCRDGGATQFTVNGQQQCAVVKNGLVTSPYATVQDVYDISIPEDQQFDYKQSTIATWLSVGGARINEWLGQRFLVCPLTIWSSTVVWANCELAYIGATRRRGINSEGLLADFRAREEAVMSWLKAARDSEISPDVRLSIQNLPTQVLRYQAQPARGWERDGAVGWYGGNSGYSGSGRSGRY